MNSRDRMINHLPSIYHECSEFEAIVTAEGETLDKAELDIDDLLNQLFVDTATWTLARREKIFGIPVNENKPLNERRSVIKSKMRGSGKVDAALLKNVADSYTNGDVDIKFDGRIIIKFQSVLGIPSNLDDLKSVMEEIKPGKLRIIYEFSYLVIKDIHTVMTIQELEQTSLSKFAGGA